MVPGIGISYLVKEGLNIFGGVHAGFSPPGPGIDDDDDWVEEEHDLNGNGNPDKGEENVDEADEGRMQRNDISLFPLIPTIGLTIYF